MNPTTIALRAAALYVTTYLVWTVLFPVVSDLMLWIVTGLACVSYLAVGAYVWMMTGTDTPPSAVRAAIARRRQQ